MTGTGQSIKALGLKTCSSFNHRVLHGGSDNVAKQLISGPAWGILAEAMQSEIPGRLSTPMKERQLHVSTEGPLQRLLRMFYIYEPRVDIQTLSMLLGLVQSLMIHDAGYFDGIIIQKHHSQEWESVLMFCPCHDRIRGH